MLTSVAVIDIGSNTIKLLVAARGAEGTPATVDFAVEEARLGGGLGSAGPQLSTPAMAAARAAIGRLLARAQTHAPDRILLVATSAVRDAANGAEFCSGVRSETTHTVRLLSGAEEAHYIGRGLAADPALAGLATFHLFDLGGGSLECLTFRDRRVTQALSLPLGCVRLTGQCVTDPAGVFTAADRERVAHAVRHSFSESAFRFDLPPPASAVVTGGTMTTARAIFASASSGGETSPVTRANLEALLTRCGSLPLVRRCEIPGLPAARADVFPAALATLVEIARLGALEGFRHSIYNLRYGLAAEALGLP